jgi:hypothetical protein
MRLRFASILFALAVAGCAARAAPYRFDSPLLSGVTARVTAPRSEPDDDDDSEAASETVAAAPTKPRRGGHRAAPITAEELLRQPDVASADDPLPPEDATSVRATTPSGKPARLSILPGVPSTVTLSRLTAPHRTEGAADLALPARPAAAELRELVGTRVTDDPLAFAVRVAARMTGAKRTPDPVPTDGEALEAWADEHATRQDPAKTRAGDLLVFDRAIDDKPASVWAVVLGADPRGVTEILFVGGGIVRRGFVDPARPRVARDKAGHVHNTFLRFGKNWPPKGTRYLTGELLSSGFRLR